MQNSFWTQTDKQQTHGEIILDAIRREWCHSADLVALTKTRNLQARISGLEASGWTIERRPTTDYRDGVEYRATVFTARTKTGPKQLHIKVPVGCPAEAIKEAKLAAERIMQEAIEATNGGDTVMDFFAMFGE